MPRDHGECNLITEEVYMSDEGPGPAFQFTLNAPPRMHTRCPDCDGYGFKAAPTAYAEDNEGASVIASKTCKTCKGKSRLPGFQPPV